MEFITPSTHHITDTIHALSIMVDMHNDVGGVLGDELCEKILGNIAEGISSLQLIDTSYFTVEEINWINELSTQLNTLSDSQGEYE